MFCFEMNVFRIYIDFLNWKTKFILFYAMNLKEIEEETNLSTGVLVLKNMHYCVK